MESTWEGAGGPSGARMGRLEAAHQATADQMILEADGIGTEQHQIITALGFLAPPMELSESHRRTATCTEGSLQHCTCKQKRRPSGRFEVSRAWLAHT